MGAGPWCAAGPVRWGGPTRVGRPVRLGWPGRVRWVLDGGRGGGGFPKARPAGTGATTLSRGCGAVGGGGDSPISIRTALGGGRPLHFTVRDLAGTGVLDASGWAGAIGHGAHGAVHRGNLGTVNWDGSAIAAGTFHASRSGAGGGVAERYGPDRVTRFTGHAADINPVVHHNVVMAGDSRDDCCGTVDAAHMFAGKGVMVEAGGAEVDARHKRVAIHPKPEGKSKADGAAIVGEADARPVAGRWGQWGPAAIAIRVAPAYPGGAPDDIRRPAPAGPVVAEPASVVERGPAP